MSYNNNFQLNTDDHPRERHDFENNDQFETENISKYLGHNLSLTLTNPPHSWLVSKSSSPLLLRSSSESTGSNFSSSKQSR